MIVDPFCAVDSIRVARFAAQRKLGSSWKPTHIRSAATAAGAAMALRAHRTKTMRTSRRTRPPSDGCTDRVQFECHRLESDHGTVAGRVTQCPTDRSAGSVGQWRTLVRVSEVSVWEAIFMLVVLKIPMVYLGAVVWWAIRAEPRAGDGADGGDGAPAFVPLTPCG